MALKINSASGSITLTAEDGSGNADVTIPRDGIVSDLSDLSITATAAEINKLDGVTATATELNYVDGVTSNIQTQLDAKGTVSSLSDLSVTATAAEINKLDGVTATTAELNYIDGVTSNIQTQLDQKAASLTDLSVTATAAELNILDGATLTTTELNYVDGVTSAIQTQIDGKLSTSLKGAASGLAELDSSGLVPTSQLPSYVDDVLEYTNASSFPGTGETGKIYVALDTNDIYRWSGSAYVKVSDAVSTSDQATALATARTIALTGDVTGSTSFDGSANVSITATIADDSHNHVISNVDGLQTALDAKADLSGDTFTGNVGFNDNVKAQFGASNDLEIYCDGANSVIQDTSAGAMIIKGSSLSLQNQAGSQYYLQANDGSFTKLYHNGAEKLSTISTGISVSGDVDLTGELANSTTRLTNMWFSGAIDGGDNAIIRLGNSDDLKLIHDGSNSRIETNSSSSGDLYLKSQGTGHDLYLQAADDIFIRPADGENGIKVLSDGGVELYHNNVNKLQTTSSGANVTGTLTADGLTVDGTLDIEEVREFVQLDTNTGSSTFAVDSTARAIVYLTSNQTANRTLNFTNVNSLLSVGQSYTATVLASQGSTAYYFNAYQVDGTAVTPKWSGGSAPSAGNASGIDVYTFTIIKISNATFTVLASVTQYA